MLERRGINYAEHLDVLLFRIWSVKHMVSARIKEGLRFKNQSNDDQNNILQNNSQS